MPVAIRRCGAARVRRKTVERRGEEGRVGVGLCIWCAVRGWCDTLVVMVDPSSSGKRGCERLHMGASCKQVPLTTPTWVLRVARTITKVLTSNQTRKIREFETEMERGGRG